MQTFTITSFGSGEIHDNLYSQKCCAKYRLPEFALLLTLVYVALRVLGRLGKWRRNAKPTLRNISHCRTLLWKRIYKPCTIPAMTHTFCWQWLLSLMHFHSKPKIRVSQRPSMCFYLMVYVSLVIALVRVSAQANWEVNLFLPNSVAPVASNLVNWKQKAISANACVCGVACLGWLGKWRRNAKPTLCNISHYQTLL